MNDPQTSKAHKCTPSPRFKVSSRERDKNAKNSNQKGTQARILFLCLRILLWALVYQFSMTLKVVFIILSQHLTPQEIFQALLVFPCFLISDSKYRLYYSCVFCSSLEMGSCCVAKCKFRIPLFQPPTYWNCMCKLICLANFFFFHLTNVHEKTLNFLLSMFWLVWADKVKMYFLPFPKSKKIRDFIWGHLLSTKY